MGRIAEIYAGLKRAMGFEPTTLGLGSRGAIIKAASDAAIIALCYRGAIGLEVI